MSWNVGLFEHRLNSVFLNGTSFFNPKEWKQNNIRAKRKQKILRRKLKLVKNFLFYPKCIITNAQSLLSTGLQQSHLISIQPVEPLILIISEGYHKNVIGIVVDGQSAETFVQVLFSVFLSLEWKQFTVWRATRINVEWSLAELPVSKETVLLRRQRNECER